MSINVAIAHLREHPTHRKTFAFEFHTSIIYTYACICIQETTCKCFFWWREGSGGEISVLCVQI